MAWAEGWRPVGPETGTAGKLWYSRTLARGTGLVSASQWAAIFGCFYQHHRSPSLPREREWPAGGSAGNASCKIECRLGQSARGLGLRGFIGVTGSAGRPARAVAGAAKNSTIIRWRMNQCAWLPGIFVCTARAVFIAGPGFYAFRRPANQPGDIPVTAPNETDRPAPA